MNRCNIYHRGVSHGSIVFVVLLFFGISCTETRNCAPFDYAGTGLDTHLIRHDQIFRSSDSSLLAFPIKDYMVYDEPTATGSFVKALNCANGVAWSHYCAKLRFGISSYFIIKENVYTYSTSVSPEFVLYKHGQEAMMNFDTMVTFTTSDSSPVRLEYQDGIPIWIEVDGKPYVLDRESSPATSNVP